MNSARLAILLGFTLILPLGAVTTPAAQGQLAQRSETIFDRHSNGVPVYKPPFDDVPSRRVSGDIRGAKDSSGPLLNALVPDHPGLTINPQPTVYWYLSKPVNVPLELTLIDGQSISPLLEVKLGIAQSGVHHFRLSDYPLKPGVEYQWFIVLVPDPMQRAGDIIAGGVIQRVQPSTALSARLQRASKQELPSIYAAEGLWYDALDSISELIDANPKEKTLRAQRAALLEQVELLSAAAYDRNARP